MRYRVVAVGGTFDILHKGHIALLDKAFEVGDHVIIGVTSDSLVARMGKRISNDYSRRVRNLSSMLVNRYPSRRFDIIMLDDEFGPTITDPSIEAIVVSRETEHKCKRLNEIREANGMKPLHIIAIDLLLADDGERISSSRIRAGEIDADGRVLRSK
ncbi:MULTISPECIES: phosphopantetheine adenylyltransferase [Candidatus Nitrosocaldus]|jgi:pantetheine-phosphate adenylyltransferase|uniref:Phosphopantetheine adenylyltransferase n=1 Tax=Candidatus Nitrosocaldus cavascurensis TaxID=2058097 RepID=A0A2K5ASL1_9ARCH|nr:MULTISPECIES: pantetheine-phosphate adenylyltransferase [Candidatus Nitrosocaldus]SPC34632.1 Phosphopantetheine adenylyltransferase [Candidatus Nitrosocaldus cavascurensis]